MPRARNSLSGTTGARAPVQPKAYFDARSPKPIGKEGVHLRAAQGKQCGVTVTGDDSPVWLTCERAVKHEGCHLDVENDTWFDEYEGRWIIMPRQRLTQKAQRGRKSPTRKGV